jgi:hypothetical protein
MDGRGRGQRARGAGRGARGRGRDNRVILPPIEQPVAVRAAPAPRAPRPRRAPTRFADGDEDIVEDAENEDVIDLEQDFQHFNVIDGEDSDGEEEAGNPPQQEPGPDVIPGALPMYEQITVIGRPEDTINRVFQPGNQENPPSLDRFLDYSVIQLILHLAEGFFGSLMECSNMVAGVDITLKDMYCYHALLTLMTYMKLGSVDDYFKNQELFEWTKEVATLKEVFNRDRYFYVRKHMRGYHPTDDIPTATKGFKVKRPVAAVQEVFRGCMNPGEFMSADEGMAKGSSMRNPIYTSLGKAKPLEGYRFFLLVDYVTKVVVWFILDEKELTGENCANFPGKFSGKVIDVLCACGTFPLPGSWYRVMADNYYNSVPLTVFMRDHRRIYVGGTMQKKYAPPQIRFGTSKRPKPSIAYPKGTLKMVKMLQENGIFLYGYMDSASVYFIDGMYGPFQHGILVRKNALGDPVHYTVPHLVIQYNKYMHAVDVFDQMRKMFGADLLHRTAKWTVRLFEIMWSFIMAQGYNIHRHLHKNDNHKVDHHVFMIRVVRGLLSHPVVRPPALAPLINHHVMKQHDLGSRGDGTNRRKVQACRGCKNLNIDGTRNALRNTPFYCSVCQVGFHPACFGPWHTLHNASPAKKTKRPRVEVENEENG